MACEDEQTGAGTMAGFVGDRHRPVAMEPGEDVGREGMIGARAFQRRTLPGFVGLGSSWTSRSDRRGASGDPEDSARDRW